ncbi:hypothetical protein ABZS66_28160 [Dactylosporangium sp. NPDC005572]|uniref:hypothetical protein n=1 Tax=Dactylosporangium sp. NPDC005572 TaxID=3156889 RepID=UPI0033A778F9
MTVDADRGSTPRPQIGDTVPLRHLDAGNHHDVRSVLVLLIEHALATRRGRAGRPAAPTRF